MSIKIKIYNQKAESVGDMNLSDKIFSVKVNENLVHQVMVTQMANERQVLAHTKDRSEVRGGGAKPWRQKGTGRARAGSSRSPIWIGGGITFGPRKDRNFKKKINKKMKQKAMLMVLSDKVKNNSLVVLDKLEMKEYKTKMFAEMLRNLETLEHKNAGTQKHPPRLGPLRQVKDEASEAGKNRKVKRSVLVISDKKDDKVKYSGRNLVGVKIINLSNINIIDLLKYKDVIVTVNVINKLQERYENKKS